MTGQMVTTFNAHTCRAAVCGSFHGYHDGAHLLEHPSHLVTRLLHLHKFLFHLACLCWRESTCSILSQYTKPVSRTQKHGARRTSTKGQRLAWSWAFNDTAWLTAPPDTISELHVFADRVVEVGAVCGSSQVCRASRSARFYK